MYTTAKRILGLWTILLLSDVGNPHAVPQFRSLSRKTANDWATANTPAPVVALNVNAGAAVWRARVV